MESEQLFEMVARILRECGVNAAAADTGAGVTCLVIAAGDGSVDEPRFVFGTAAERWAAEVIDGPTEGLWTDVGSDEENPRIIASGILASLGRFSGSHA